MEVYSLNGKWKMKDTRKEHWSNAQVPGSVFTDLLREGLMEDPFYRDNEDKALALSYNDYEYSREFHISDEMLKYDRIFLCCEGLDTLAEIKVNGKLVARTDNMHRSYKFNVKAALKEGRNNIHIIFYSPTRYIERMQKENPLLERKFNIAVPGFYHLRKAHSMFGWDWGPEVPDSGIWRDISLKFFKMARLKDTYITQNHRKNSVNLRIRISTEIWVKEKLSLEISIISPEGRKISRTLEADYLNKNYNADFTIKEPELWWPNGYGKQSLYRVKIDLKGEGKILNSKEFKIGLRTLNIKQKNDKWGESFEFEINGVPIFARGANYIIEDNLMSRYSPQRTEMLIKNCIQANFNCIRVWGGGIYPADYFFELCDQYGLIVWQDFMFACSIYPVNREFISNVKQELEDNIKRLRNHTCLGLWCGNNEIEWIIDMVEKQPPVELQVPKYILSLKMKQIKKTYIYLFEEIISKALKKYDPNRFYWPSSPSSGGRFDNPNDENRGDVHYWDVWHGLKPFNDYRNHYFRFTSEFGFQSFPAIKTVESFTVPEDRNIFSYVMEKHQKNGSANSKILTYLAETFKYPKDFESLLYTSQILQAEAIKYGVEHWRRNRGHCMGSLYWQLNDCWPVASWSSIDYYGRWKALHYYARRFFAPVLISAEDNGTKVNIYITNDTLKDIEGAAEWKLRSKKIPIVSKGKKEVIITSLKAESCVKLNFEDIINKDNIRDVYLEFFFNVDGQCVSSGTLLFTKPKYFNFINPEIKAAAGEEDEYFIFKLESQAFAKSVELDLRKTDCQFNDNYFDLSPGYMKKITLNKASLSKKIKLDEIKKQLRIRSLHDIEER